LSLIALRHKEKTVQVSDTVEERCHVEKVDGTVDKSQGPGEQQQKKN